MLHGGADQKIRSPQNHVGNPHRTKLEGVTPKSVSFRFTLHNMLRANPKRDGGLLVDESWRRVTWLQKECVLVLADAGGAGGAAGKGRREAGFLGDETGGGGWKVKMGEEGEDSGEKDGE